MSKDILPDLWWINPWIHAKQLADALVEKDKMLNMAKIHVGVLANSNAELRAKVELLSKKPKKRKK
jgi:hypothetical protein